MCGHARPIPGPAPGDCTAPYDSRLRIENSGRRIHGRCDGGGTAPLTVRFTDTSFNNPTSWSWDLDGDDRSDSQASDPEYTYAVPGSYTVTLTVTNRAGTDTAVNQSSITVGKEVPAPVAGVSASPVWGTKPLTDRFTDESRNNPTAWGWDFDNDGETDSQEKNQVWTYPETGVYTVRLTVSSDAGKDEEVREAAIIVLEPVTASRTPIPTTIVPTPSILSTSIPVLRLPEYSPYITIALK